jgi:3-deoxy-D-manno-octulosonic-acid transferase
MKRPMSVGAYRLASQAVGLAAPLLLERRKRRGKEDPNRMAERRGVPGLPRPEGILVWMHGASVGEVVSLLPIVEHFIGLGVGVLVTSGTVTSAEVAARRLPKGAIHQYIPLDVPAYLKRFLDHWQPNIGLFAESELWPNLIHEAQARGTHLAIVNARMSERSHRRWQKMPNFIGSMLSRFELVLAQSDADADRVRSLGAPRVLTMGNLKYDVLPPPADDARLSALSSAVAGRPLLLAASTHAGEEAILADVHAFLKRSIPKLLTVIAPRHPARGEELAAELASRDLRVIRRAPGDLPQADTEIYLADTIGEMGLYYRLGGVVFMGGSLVRHGGQNPIEPAKLGNAILFGPHVHNFTDVYAALVDARGAFEVSDAEALKAAVHRLLTDVQLRSRMAEEAEAKVTSLSGAIARTIGQLEPMLMQAMLERGA